MRTLDLTDPNPPRERKNSPEKVKLLVASRMGATWGELEPLRGTSWAEGIEEISEDALGHALHGNLQPLLRELGRPPHVSGSRVTDLEGECALKGSCPIWNKSLCRPGGKLKKELGPLECYEPPLSQGTKLDILFMMRDVALAWKEGRHTVVVGDTFNLL